MGRCGYLAGVDTYPAPGTGIHFRRGIAIPFLPAADTRIAEQDKHDLGRYVHEPGERQHDKEHPQRDRISPPKTDAHHIGRGPYQMADRFG